MYRYVFSLEYATHNSGEAVTQYYNNLTVHVTATTLLYKIYTPATLTMNYRRRLGPLHP